MRRYVSRVVLILFLVTLSAGGVTAQGTPVVLPGYESAAVGKAAVVFRNFAGGSGHEIFLGGPVGGGESSPIGSKGELPGPWPSPSHVTFRYDGSTIYASAQGTDGQGQCEYPIGSLGSINYIRISVVALEAGTTVSLLNARLGSAVLGDFLGVSGRYRNWHVKGTDLSAGFTIEGDITLSAGQPPEGENRVVVEVGYLGGTSYVFAGFDEPLTMGVTNVASPGRSIPVKWRLTDGDGAPVSDATSFVGLYSYPVSCDTFSGDPADAVPEVATGASGLQYQGDGYWQYNWKTPKTYGNTCRAMYVEFDSGITSPLVSLRFK